MTENMKKELEHWKFLDSWNGILPWRKEKHFVVKVISDASVSGWGGTLSLTESPKYTRDYWSPDEVNTPGGIAVKEAKALHQTLSTFAGEIVNGREDARVDNFSLIDFWKLK